MHTAGVEVYLLSFLTSALSSDGWSASCHRRKDSGSQWTGSQEGPTVSLDLLGKRTFLVLPRNQTTSHRPSRLLPVTIPTGRSHLLLHLSNKCKTTTTTTTILQNKNSGASEIKIYDAIFEVLTVVLSKFQVFCVVTSCWLVNSYRRFGVL
jgi:hypothetical protein